MNLLDKAKKIPGMIEPVEQSMLFELAQNVHLSQNDYIVEFGTFFGRSTSCLASGLLKNNLKNKSNVILALDSFSCSSKGSFSSIVENMAKIGNVDNLIEISQQKMSFQKIFENYLYDEIKEGIVIYEAKELKNSFPLNKGKIALIHIDSPKFYREFSFIINRFFPLLKKNSFIVFQDYFYHWSATLIAAIQMLCELKLIKFLYSKASSLCVQVCKIPSQKELNTIDQQMNKNNVILQMLDSAIKMTKSYNIDRETQFSPRLYLAKIQFLYSIGEIKHADKLRNFMNHSEMIIKPVLDDYMELLKFNFSMEKLYLEDHQLDNKEN